MASSTEPAAEPQTPDTFSTGTVSGAEESPPPVIEAEVKVFVDGEHVAKFSIIHGEYVIGRDATCQIIVDAENVSRHHARLSFAAYELLLEDMGSVNGTFIDGVQVQLPTRIRPDQEIAIGAARLFVRLKPEAGRMLAAALWDPDLGLLPIRAMLEGKKYKVVTTIGRGGMGVVYQSRDLRIRRTVAMKVMRTASQFSRENVLRFVEEAQLTGQLEHPNIVPVYELGLDSHGEVFYTMKYVKGITLQEVLKGIRTGREEIIEKYPLGALLTIFEKVCDAVAFAHSKGVVHRDLKPENIMIGSYGEVLVMDWGLAKNLTAGVHSENLIDPTPVRHGQQSVPTADERGFQTLHGLIVGTPPYISPEAARGDLEKIDTRSDIYVLGAILYNILTLHPPFPGKEFGELVEQIVSGQFKPPTGWNTATRQQRGRGTPDPSKEQGHDEAPLAHLPGRRVPEGLAAIVMKAMSYEPELRYQRVEELQAELVAWQGGFAPKAERASLGKQIWLWTVRHKTEVTMVSSFVVLAFGAIIWALIHLKAERDKAIFAQRQAEQALEQAAKSESKAAQMLGELREAAYIFASEADSLIEAGNFKEALRVLDDAIEKKPEEIAFRLKRGNILGSMFAFEEALKAYQKVQEMQPNNETARQNIALLQRIIPRTTDGELPPMLVLYELHKAMLDQGRLDEAIAVSKRVTDDRQMFQQTMRATMTRFGLREDRWQQTESGNLVLNLSRINLMEGFGPKKFRLINLRELRNRPVVELRIENSSVPDLTPLAGWRLEVLVAGGNPIVDLSPLRGMPLRELNIAGTFVRDLTPLMGMPLEILDASETRVGSLKPLGKSKIEELNVSGCKAITDIADLKDLPLQKLNLSNTGVVSVAALAGSRIRELRLEGCRSVTDLRPLLRCESLETLILPNQLKDVEYLREHPSLRWLSYRRSSQTIAEFWAENSKK